MDKLQRQVLSEVQIHPGASEENIEYLKSQVGVPLPEDYLDFLRSCNGGEGVVGKGYIVLWPSNEIAMANAEYEVEKNAPGLVLIGTDGGNTAYGIDTRCRNPASMRYIETDLIVMGWDAIFFETRSFTDLILHMAN